MQSVLEFREELFSLIDEAYGINIGVNDLICMMLQIGISDPGLQRELGTIRDPTHAAFNDKIEGYEQARRNTHNTAYSNVASRGSASRRPANQGSRPASRPNIPCAASVFAAQKLIILSLNVTTQKE